MSNAQDWPCLRIETSGKGRQTLTRVILDTSVSPNAPRTEVTGWHDGALRLRLAAHPWTVPPTTPCANGWRSNSASRKPRWNSSEARPRDASNGR